MVRKTQAKKYLLLLFFLVLLLLSGCQFQAKTPTTVEEAIQGEWVVGSCLSLTGDCDFNRYGVLVLNDNSYEYLDDNPENNIQDQTKDDDNGNNEEDVFQSFMGRPPLTFLADNPKGEVEFVYAEGINSSENIDLYKHNHYLAEIFLLSGSDKAGYIIMINEERLHFHSMISEISVWEIEKSID